MRRHLATCLGALVVLGACGKSELFSLRPDGAAGGPTGGQVGADGQVGTGGQVGPCICPPPGVGGSGGEGAFDPGRIAIDRLNNYEYDNTMMDLLGVNGMAQATFPPDEECEFDNCADAFTMTDARYEQYFNNADMIGEEVFADTSPTGLLQKYVYGLVSPACTPSATDTTCSSQIIAAFGAKAWRRPLTTQEVQGLQTLATNAISLGETADGSIKQVVKTMLASPQFIYRIEYDPNPTSTAPHAISPYEMASRLSYLGWSSMPDQTLFDLAASGQILTDAILTQQVDRMLADPKGANFTTSFAGQWLGARDMQAHQVEPTAFPNFDDALRSAFVTEELLYFDQFLTGPLPVTQFLTNTNNFVNTRLARHYGFGNPTGTSFQMVTNGSAARVGFMGLGSFLTFTSYSYRTAITLRGKWILLNLYCQEIPAPPPNEPALDPFPNNATNPATQQEDVRAQMMAYTASADCAPCHALLDPIGYGLENFDGIGAYRTKYSATSTTTIVASSTLPTGETFNSLPQLALILSQGKHLQQLTDCASHKMMTYALARDLTTSDDPYLNQVRMQWSGQGYSLRDLMKDVVINDTFKFRRGEP
jgi:Protein of unknown function (DUF1592)/Protein of unknown function (DUF1588)/Protein of unknown function (DUF1595)/Protein of unknown function (DUF1587)/Protein of unknown function (DUF1585)